MWPASLWTVGGNSTQRHCSQLAEACTHHLFCHETTVLTAEPPHHSLSQSQEYEIHCWVWLLKWVSLTPKWFVNCTFLMKKIFWNSKLINNDIWSTIWNTADHHTLYYVQTSHFLNQNLPYFYFQVISFEKHRQNIMLNIENLYCCSARRKYKYCLIQ